MPLCILVKRRGWKLEKEQSLSWDRKWRHGFKGDMVTRDHAPSTLQQSFYTYVNVLSRSKESPMSIVIPRTFIQPLLYVISSFYPKLIEVLIHTGTTWPCNHCKAI